MSNNIRIDDHTNEFLNSFDGALEKALEGIGVHIEGEAKELLTKRFYPHKTGESKAYVDTGLLRNSITYALDGEQPKIQEYTDDKGQQKGHYEGAAPKDSNGRSVMIGTNVEYAPYIHEGTSKIAPNRFLKDAVEMNKDQIKDYIEKELKKI